MPLQITVNVRFVAAHTLTEVLWWNPTLVLDVTLQTVFPLVVTAAALTLPRFGVILMLKHDLFLFAGTSGASTYAATCITIVTGAGRLNYRSR